MINMHDLRVFSEIVQENSFAAAAAKLGLSPATASGRLKALEDNYGLSLINRTTRSLSLTEDGRLLFEQSLPLLSQLDSLDQQLTERKQGITGLISVSTPTEFGRSQILPLINEFSDFYPEIEFKIVFEECSKLRSTEDADVMIRFGPLPDCALTTRKLGRNPILTCASPRYLARHGVPRNVEALDRHNCLRFQKNALGGSEWKFRVDGESFSKTVKGSRTVTDVRALADLAVVGTGLIQASYWDICDLLENGQLVTVLDEYRPQEQIISLVSESRGKLPRRTQVFIDFLLHNMRGYGEAVLSDLSDGPCLVTS